MRKVNKTLKVYKFRELSEDIKDMVINQHIEYLIDITDFESLHKNSGMYRAYSESVKNQTPYFLGQLIWKYCQKQILGDLKEFEYLANGEVYEEE